MYTCISNISEHEVRELVQMPWTQHMVCSKCMRTILFLTDKAAGKQSTCYSLVL